MYIKKKFTYIGKSEKNKMQIFSVNNESQHNMYKQNSKAERINFYFKLVCNSQVKCYFRKLKKVYKFIR